MIREACKKDLKEILGLYLFLHETDIPEENHCYKMMLLTGSKEEKTLDSHKNAGYNSSDKTAFIQWIEI